MMLQGKIIKLRALEPSDIDVLYKWENDTTIWKVSNTTTPFSRLVLEQYLLSSHNDIYTNKQLRLVVELIQPTNPIGLIDLFDFDPQHLRAGIGILVGEEKEKQKGYASEALALLIDYCFSVLNLHQLYCNIGESNGASVSLFEKQGFKITGEKKEWIKAADKWENEFLLQLIK